MSLALVVADESCQEQAPGSAVSAPRAAEAQENTSHRLQKEGEPASSQKWNLLGAGMGKARRDSRIVKRGRSQGRMGDKLGCFLNVWENKNSA